MTYYKSTYLDLDEEYETRNFDAIGDKFAEVLGITKKRIDGRYHIAGGSKNGAGLYLTIRRMVLEAQEALENENVGI